MSSTLPPDVLSPNNPIRHDTVTDILEKLGVTVPLQDVEVYTSLLEGIWEVWNNVEQMGDYVPDVDENRFPRQEVHRATAAENVANAWAWKCVIKDTKPNHGLLAGRTICLKDTIAVKGVPCLLGTDMIKDWVPNTDATITTRILEAGGVITGKGVCENLCLWGLSNSAATGGSSSGTAVCVGLGLADLGVGGDQGGSIRLPCCVNGLVGLKPTFGLVPYTGIASMEPMLDFAGPMTRVSPSRVDGIDDRQAAGTPFPAEVPDYPSMAKLGVLGLKVGIITESLDQPMHDDRVSKLLVRAAEALRSLGAAEVSMVSIPMHKIAPELWAVPGRMGGTSSFLARSSGRRGLALNDLTDKMLPLTQDKVDGMFPSGINMLVNGLWAFEHLSPSLRDAYLTALSKYDVLITPTLPFLAPKLPPEGASIAENMSRNLGLSTNTSAFNLTGLPALTLPVGRLESLEGDGALLPVGMQIIGKNFAEPTLFRVAYAWEQAHNWVNFG
ncbi:hypothetical protein EHS25_007303 [Saitozyma podzolica]|uniref:Amidase domain-containing protein n=1 Tax=Saitozyma podzolica TaxID=1890683 RepID=A0A427XMH1_9TREE|nr:hypothetical protein EHS25_007303 [Saitozyma podzolica]